ncbi:MAG: lipopolysaccharide kinase InaA family protein [Halioglobus sp.]
MSDKSAGGAASIDGMSRLRDGDSIVESAFRQSVKILKEDNFSYAGLCSSTPLVDAAFVKCYLPKGLLGRMVARLRWSRADRLFRRAGAIDLHLPVVKPLSIVRNLTSSRVYVFYPLAAGKNLSELLNQDRPDDRQLGCVLSMVGAALAEFHQAGWCHGDFKWGNVVVSLGAQGYDDPKICFVDLDGCRRTGSTKSAARDLARFIVNAEDYQVNEAVVRQFIGSYAAILDEPAEKVLLRCGKPLRKLRRRHDRKYGLRDTSLFERETG